MKFEAQEVALQIVRSLRDVIEAVRRQDTELANQIRKAASSMVLNLGEASRRLGRDRTHLFSIASGSAREVRDRVEAAQAWGYLDDVDLTTLSELLDRELAMTWRLTHPRRS